MEEVGPRGEVGVMAERKFDGIGEVLGLIDELSSVVRWFCLGGSCKFIFGGGGKPFVYIINLPYRQE